jgi:hypothetical protein
MRCARWSLVPNGFRLYPKNVRGLIDACFLHVTHDEDHAKRWPVSRRVRAPMSHGFACGLPSARVSSWPAPGSEDTELGVLMEPEVGHGETEVYPRVQA